MATQRRGPRVDVDVRALLIDTAERMLGTQARESVSLRAIAREAGVTPAALSHHFTERDDLLEAVVMKRSSQVMQANSARFTALITQSEPVTIEAVVSASLRALIDVVNDDPVGGFHWLRVVTQLALNGDPLFYRLVTSHGNMPKLYIAAAGRAMPNLTDVEVRRRTTIALYLAMVALANADLEGWGSPLGPDGLDPLFVEQLLVFTSAGLAAVPPPPQPRNGVARRTSRRKTYR